MRFVLASKSPRRIELVKKIFKDLSLTPDFKCIAADIDESIRKNENPVNHVKRLAQEKVQKILPSLDGECLVLAADTIVVLKDKIFGKPSDKNDAKNILQQLSGNEHQVITGFCLMATAMPSSKIVDYDISRVWFKGLTAKEIKDYIDSDEPMDKAGAYAIQGLANQFVTKMAGSFTNIVGLPCEKIAELLKQNFEK